MKTKLVMLAITALFAASSLRAGVEPICVDVKASVWTVGVGKVTEMAVIDGGLQGSLPDAFLVHCDEEGWPS